MPRNGSGVYSLPAGYVATTNQVAQASQHNLPLEDLAADANALRPIVAGGTGGSTKAAARLNLDMSAQVVTRGSNYTAVVSDRAKLIRATGAMTLSLATAATLGDGWYADVRADGGDLTIDPAGSETINGEATLVIKQNRFARIQCDGTAFYAQFLGVTDAVGMSDLVSSYVPIYGTGAALPTSNIGPIWHEDYASIMTWQVFNANGANYTGYASKDIGRPSFDGQSSARSGHLRLDGSSVSDITYGALAHWATHNFLTTGIGSWLAGQYQFASNGDGTYRIPDLRGEFMRFWDGGRGVDPGRFFGSLQANALQNFRLSSLGRANAGATVTSFMRVHNNLIYGSGAVSSSLDRLIGANVNQFDGSHSDIVPVNAVVANETRPRNVALLASIKF